MTLRKTKPNKDLTRDWGDASGPSIINYSTFHWSLIRNCLYGNLKKGNNRSKRYAQLHENWTNDLQPQVLLSSKIIPKAQIWTLLLCEIILTEANTTSRALKKSFKKPRELFLKAALQHLNKACIRWFRRYWKIKMAITKIDLSFMYEIQPCGSSERLFLKSNFSNDIWHS